MLLLKRGVIASRVYTGQRVIRARMCRYYQNFGDGKRSGRVS